MNGQQRRRVYAIGAALAALAAFYGLIAADAVPLWLALLGAAIGAAPGTYAARNTDPADGPVQRGGRS